MIALCRFHHDQADNGAFTKEQLHAMKNDRHSQSLIIQGEFNWLRRGLLGVLGGNFYYETNLLFMIDDTPIIWFSQDGDGYFRLNLRSRFVALEDNDWIATGAPLDFECPPSGKLIHAKYASGDELRIEFVEINDRESLTNRHPHARNSYLPHSWFPTTAVEIEWRLGGTSIWFGPDSAHLPNFFMSGAVSHADGCGIRIRGDRISVGSSAR